MSSDGTPPGHAKSWPGSAPNSLRGLVPRHDGLAEVRLVRHVARQRGVVTEHDVLRHRFPRAHCLEERPQVRPDVVEVGPAESYGLRHWRLAQLRIVLLVPFREVRLPQRPGIAAGVIARS